MIRNHLVAGMEAGLNPRTVALDLVGRVDLRGVRSGGVIGLTDTQAGWVRNFANELATDPAAALTRKLRDKRFDRAILKAIEDDKEIPADLRQKMVTAYANRALRLRAESIARTEAIASLHNAQGIAMEQAFANDAVDPSAVTQIWHTAHDNRVRDTHAVMDGQQQPWGSNFITGSGAQLRFPGDDMGPPEEVINCRCWREMKVDFLRGIR